MQDWLLLQRTVGSLNLWNVHISCRLIYCCFMLHTVVHNRINIYPLLYYGMECCSMPRASGGQDGSVVVFFLFFRPCPDVPSKSLPHRSGAYFPAWDWRLSIGCTSFLFVRWLSGSTLVSNLPPRQSIVPLINLKCSYIYRAIFWSKCDIASEILTHFMYF